MLRDRLSASVTARARHRRRELRRAQWLAAGEMGARFSLTPTPKIDGFLLLLGHPRSGSSLLTGLLEANSEIAIGHEGELLRRAQPPRVAPNHLLSMAAWYSATFQPQALRRTGYSEELAALAQADSESVRYLGDKSPGYSSDYLSWHPDAVAQLEDRLEKPVFVLVLERSPLEVISVVSQLGQQSVVAARGALVRRERGIENALCRHPADRSHVLHYANVCAEPGREVASVLRWLGVPVQPDHDARCRRLLTGGHLKSDLVPGDLGPIPPKGSRKPGVHPLASRSERAIDFDEATLRLVRDLALQHERLSRYLGELYSSR